MHIFVLVLLLQSEPAPVYEFTVGFSSMQACQKGIVFLAEKMKKENRKEFVDAADCLETWMPKEKIDSLKKNKLKPSGNTEKIM